jgi:ankyrin repeat protein
MMAKICLSLLNNHSDNWQRGSVHWQLNELNPLTELLFYAAAYWPTHVRNHGEADIDNRLTTMLEKFLGSMDNTGPAYRTWYTLYEMLDETLTDGALPGPHYKNLQPSTLASLPICLFGFNNVLSKWWAAGSINPEQRSGEGNSLLVLAILGNSLEVVQKLLDLGADVNAQLGYEGYGSALAAAVQEQENEDMVRLLIESGADVNAKLSCGEYGSALAAAAAAAGRKDMIRLLIELGADVNAQLSAGDYGSALAAAAGAWLDNEDKVRLLIKAGADVNAQLSGKYGSALAAAAYYGNENTVRLLIKAGADVNAQLSGQYGSALAAAAASGCYGSENTVRLLIESGADVNAQLSTGQYGSALAAATASGRKDKVQLLI